MTVESLKYMNEKLVETIINYEFMQWSSELIYPYWVGEYTEPEPNNEDGLQESTFMITGTTNTSWLDLEIVKAKIEKEICGKTMILSNGNGLAINYSGMLNVPTGNDSFKRMQINLNIKEWKVT